MDDARARVVAIYTQHNPDRLRDVDAIMREHEGEEQTLIDALIQKYGPEIEPRSPLGPMPPILTVTTKGPFRGAQVYSLMTVIKTNADLESMCERVVLIKPTGVCFNRRGGELRRRIAFGDISHVMVVEQKQTSALIVLRVAGEHDALFCLSDDKTEELNAFQIGGTRAIATMIRNLAIRATGNTRHIPLTDMPVGTALGSLGLNLGKLKVPEGSEEFMRKRPSITATVQQPQPQSRRLPPPPPRSEEAFTAPVPTAVDPPPPEEIPVVVDDASPPPPVIVAEAVSPRHLSVRRVTALPYAPEPSFDLLTPAIAKTRRPCNVMAAAITQVSEKNRQHELWQHDFDTSLPPPTPQRRSGVKMPLPLPLVLPAPPPPKRDSVWHTVPHRHGMSASAGASPAYWSSFMDEFNRLQNL